MNRGEGVMHDVFETKSLSPMLFAEQREAFDSPDFRYELKMDRVRCLAYPGDGPHLAISAPSYGPCWYLPHMNLIKKSQVTKQYGNLAPGHYYVFSVHFSRNRSQSAPDQPPS